MHITGHSYYSLRYGVLSPRQLVDEAVAAGLSTAALTDINNTSSAFSFIRLCKKAGIKPILGIDFRKGNQFLYLGIAKNREGWKQLCEYLSYHSLHNKIMPEQAPPLEHCCFIYVSPPKPLAQFSSNEFLGIRARDVNKLHSPGYSLHKNKLIAYCPLTFRNKTDYNVHRLLRCIDLNIVLGKLDKASVAPREDIALGHKIEEIFQQHPAVIENTKSLLEECAVEIPEGEIFNKRAFTSSVEDDRILIEKLARNGCEKKYGPGHDKARQRVESELEVIRQLGFSAYFLITWDIIRYATDAGYHHVGRGSGANSIVAYCLGITDVDPLELELYFERFINPHRKSPPDFDIDFSWDERDDVTDYIFKRHGAGHTALLATYNTFKEKSVIRELGKVFGLPKAEIDILVDAPYAQDKHHAFAPYIYKYAEKITGFPNYLGIHASGMLISEKPLNYYTALQMMPKGFPIVHFDMYEAEDLGFHKYDILSQRGLGHIKNAIDIIRENKGVQVNIHDINRIKNDPAVKDKLRSGQCIGCFYIESPAMRGLLSKLKCDNYTRLVAVSSIIRPGVAKSGMMREYILRFHQPDRYSYIHPTFEKHLSETYGIMVYQEDVIKILHYFAGLGLDESDVLRRIMTGKKKSSDTFRDLRARYFKNCKERGYSKELAEEVWRQIESFSDYSFCKAHSASFAVESFQSLFLKTYYPLEFMVAVINNFGGFYNTEIYVHELRMNGGIIHPPCINNSRHLTHIRGSDVYIGLIHLQNLEKKTAHQIIKERDVNGAFKSLYDFVQRIDISREQLDLLIRIGAFRFTGVNKYRLMWEKNAAYNPAVKHYGQTLLLDEAPASYEIPKLEESAFDQAFDEIELLGFSLSSPFGLLDEKPENMIKARHLSQYPGKNVQLLGYFVTKKHVTTVKKENMNFGTWLDEEGSFFDSTHFPDCLKKFPFKGGGCYLLRGRVVEDFGFFTVDVTEMIRLPYVKDHRYPEGGMHP